MAKRWLNSYEEASEFCGLTVRQLKARVARKEIGVNKIARNRVVFSSAELEAYCQKFWVKKAR